MEPFMSETDQQVTSNEHYARKTSAKVERPSFKIQLPSNEDNPLMS